MPKPAHIYQILLNHYNKLPWYKKAIFWLSAPRLAWGLFGYKQNPNESRVKQLIEWSKASWFFSTAFELSLYQLYERAYATATASADKIAHVMSQTSSTQRSTPLSKVVFLNRILLFAAPTAKRAAELAATNSNWHETVYYFMLPRHPRFGFSTEKLLEAVAYGKESRTVNVDKRQDREIYAADILGFYLYMLLEKGNITDWGGRTFKNITAFEYALWAKDFKMMKMMLGCIPNTPKGDDIRAALFEQYNRVTAPIYAGGGLTYTHTYDQPNLDTAGIPDGTTTTVTEEHTENHFDIKPLCNAYQDYDTHFNARTWPQRDAFWAKLIGKLQRLLPIHILQRYCDPNASFYPLPRFHDEFKRSTIDVTGVDSSLFVSSLSSKCALLRASFSTYRGFSRGFVGAGYHTMTLDLAALRVLDEVSTNEIENIAKQLSQLRPAAGLHP